MRQIRNRHPQNIAGPLGHVLDTVVDQCHQRGELVGGGPQAGLEDRQHPLPEQKRVGHVTIRGSPAMSALRGRTAPPHYCEGEAQRGRTRPGQDSRHHSSLRTHPPWAAGAYLTAVHDKLREEVDELTAAKTTDTVIEEAADVVEILIALAGDRGATLDSILDAAQRKRAER
jgi:predicted house-cleaning noncanonical NTP pyrophosphatase (MazG superfamily)